MKIRFLIAPLLLISYQAFSHELIAEFNNQGKVIVNDSAKGLQVTLDLKTNPKTLIKVGLLSWCKIGSSYQAYFRNTFEIKVISDRQGLVKYSIYFPGASEQDFIFRNLNTVGFFRMEMTKWELIKCASLEEYKVD